MKFNFFNPLPHLWTRNGHLTSLALEQLLCEDLTKAERTAITLHLSDCVSCRDAVAVMQNDDAQSPLPSLPWLQPSTEGKNDIKQGVIVKSRLGTNRLFWRNVGGLVAAAASLSLVIWLGMSFFVHRHGEPSSDFPLAPPLEMPDHIRIKGAAFSLEVLANSARVDGRVRRVNDGDAVYVGERLGFKVWARQGGYMMIVGVDERGQDYLCYPQDNMAQATLIQPTQQPIALDQAVRLDAVLGQERIIGLLCETPFTLDDLRSALADINPSTPLPILRHGCLQWGLSLVKHPAEPL